MVGEGALLWCGKPVLSSNNFTHGHLTKIERLVVTAVGAPDRAECAILGVILAVFFWSIQATFVIGDPLCDVGSPLRALISLLMVI